MHPRLPSIRLLHLHHPMGQDHEVDRFGEMHDSRLSGWRIFLSLAFLPSELRRTDPVDGDAVRLAEASDLRVPVIECFCGMKGITGGKEEESGGDFFTLSCGGWDRLADADWGSGGRVRGDDPSWRGKGGG